MLIGIVKKDDLRTLFFRKSQQLTDTFATVGIYGHENIGKLMFHLIRFVTNLVVYALLVCQNKTGRFSFISPAEHGYPVIIL